MQNIPQTNFNNIHAYTPTYQYSATELGLLDTKSLDAYIKREQPIERFTVFDMIGWGLVGAMVYGTYKIIKKVFK